MSIKQRWQGTKPINISTEEALDRVLPFLKKDRRILICYLFGSRVASEMSHSDLDIAIYTSSDFTWQDYYLLYGEITRALHSDRVDIVWLNRAEPILSFEIITQGKTVYHVDDDLLNEFEIKTKKSFYDYKLYLKRRRSA